MQGEHLVVNITRHEVGDRAGQLRSDCTCQGSADQIKQKATDQILQANHFVIDAEAEISQPARWLKSRRTFGSCVWMESDSHLRCWLKLFRWSDLVWRSH